MPQKSQTELASGSTGEPQSPPNESAAMPTATEGSERPGASALMEAVVERGNMQRALKRVKQNKGAAGVDGMTVTALPEHLRTHWPTVRAQLLAGTYQPRAVRRVAIPKDDGGERLLGIPTVLDRLIQQAILQVLQPMLDPTFSQHSYGFRPGRSAHDAVREAQRYVSEGRDWVVDVDLEKFFDRVNHDVLMGRLARRIEDKRLLKLIRRYLTAGMMADGVLMEREEGTPQGGPLSPLLANLLLDEVDKELEKRGHAFVRYADDCNVYVRTERAGERVMDGLRRLFSRLRLRVNESKSKVARAKERKFLGFTIRRDRYGVRVFIASKALVKLKQRVRELTRPTVGQSMTEVCRRLNAYLRGWKAYFGLASSTTVLKRLDGWIRTRLRALQLRHWRHPARIYRALRALGATDEMACKTAARPGRWWKTATKIAKVTLPTYYFDELGLIRLAA